MSERSYFFLLFFDFLSFLSFLSFFLSSFFAMTPPPCFRQRIIAISQSHVDTFVNNPLPFYAAVMGTDTPLGRLQEAIAELDHAPDPQTRLAVVHRIRALADELELAEVRAARGQGTSWSKIGAVYGLTKQGAQQRFRRDDKRSETVTP